MMKLRLVSLVSVLLLFVAGCGTQPTTDVLESLDVPVRLAVLKGTRAYPAANGKATYKVDNNGRREFEAEIEDVRALAGTTVDVFVNAKKVASITLDAIGDGEVELRGAAAPVIRDTATPTIRIKTPTGVVVASGLMNQFKD
jgi:hypothetical protein